MANVDLDDWVRLDVNFFHNPKVRRAGGDGQLLWIAGLLYAKRMATDGGIEGDMLDLLGFEAGLTPEAAGHAADRLVTSGLWERTADGWRVHDFERCQETRADVNTNREKARVRQARYRRKRGDVPLPGMAGDDQPESVDDTVDDVTRDRRVSHAQLTRPDTDTDTDTDTPPSSSSRVTRTSAPTHARPDDDERISKAARALAERVHEHEVAAGKVTNKRAHRRTLIANAVDDHGEALAAFYADHPDATIDDAVAHLDPTPTTKETPMAGANWTVHATYEDTEQGFVAGQPVICQSEQEAENRAADERARLFSAGKQAIDVAVQPPTHPAGR